MRRVFLHIFTTEDTEEIQKRNNTKIKPRWHEDHDGTKNTITPADKVSRRHTGAQSKLRSSCLRDCLSSSLYFLSVLCGSNP